jgi:uncharacterized protein with ParB-like and HNH nuclease domain
LPTTEGLISKSDFIRILNLIESYLFRRTICGIPTNSLNKTFATLYKEIRKGDFYAESVVWAFKCKDSYRRFPDDAELVNAFKTKGIYNLQRRTYLFDKLENLDRKEPVNIGEYTIEHIMPQNPKVGRQGEEVGVIARTEAQDGRADD